MKDPVKYARKELPKLGAVLVREHDGQLWFDMPQGGTYKVSSRTQLARIVAVVESMREYRNPLKGYTAAGEVPPIVNVDAVPHFTDRFELMQRQESLTGDEVNLALHRPTRVWRAGRRFAFERGRVIVIAQVARGKLTLITVLWAEEKLWARNPRPGRYERV